MFRGHRASGAGAGGKAPSPRVRDRLVHAHGRLPGTDARRRKALKGRPALWTPRAAYALCRPPRTAGTVKQDLVTGKDEGVCPSHSLRGLEAAEHPSCGRWVARSVF